MNINISSIFNNRVDADKAFDALQEAGVNQKDISVVMRNDTEVSEVNDKAAVGASSGALVGGLAGLLVGVSALIIPGIGAVVVGGPIVAALGLTGAAAVATGAATGAVAGAATGGLVGGLVGLGLTEEDAELYETKIKKGAVLLYITTDKDNEGMVKRVLANNNASEIQVI